MALWPKHNSLISIPILVEIRIRETKDGGKGVDVFSDTSIKQERLQFEDNF